MQSPHYYFEHVLERGPVQTAELAAPLFWTMDSVTKVFRQLMMVLTLSKDLVVGAEMS